MQWPCGCLFDTAGVTTDESSVQQPQPHPQPTGSEPPSSAPPYARRDFYRIAQECRAHATELARYDQHRVKLEQCHLFNNWLAQLRSSQVAAPLVHSMKPARPIARWQVMSLGSVGGVLLLLGLPLMMSRAWASSLLMGYLVALLMVFFMPERLYGTTIEMLEGKVLVVVEGMESMLLAEELTFTQAAYFQVKANLVAAKEELRQQLDLAHRRL